MSTTTPDWIQLAIYAGGAAFLVMVLQRVPFVGRIFRVLFSFALLAICFFLLLQQAPFDANLSRLTQRLGIDRQEVVGREVRIRMSPDGHFWANATINGLERRMLIDSGATITTLSDSTAKAAGIADDEIRLPVVLRTANGVVPAKTVTIDDLRVASITASDLKAVSSPTLGGMNVIGMNFLSRLKTWSVEDGTLILVPRSDPAAVSRNETGG